MHGPIKHAFESYVRQSFGGQMTQAQYDTIKEAFYAGALSCLTHIGTSPDDPKLSDQHRQVLVQDLARFFEGVVPNPTKDN